MLEARSGRRIELKFESFDVEYHAKCSWDFVEVSSLFFKQKYCGYEKPGPFTSIGNTMKVKFHTDGSVTRTGFRASWTEVI